MIIDFHAHVFPDRIAERTVGLLEAGSGSRAYSDGRASGLVRRLDEAGADMAVNLPVLTSPRQFDSVLQFAVELNEAYRKEGRILSFAGIHPDVEDIEGKIRAVADSGIPGVKIHPDYQGRFINDPRYIKILECARDAGLVVVTHAGVDAAFPGEPVKCPPSLALEVIRRVKGVKLVLAHLGGNKMQREVLDTLMGEDVYLDTALVLKHTPREVFSEMLRRHGEDRILFATDSPWSGIAEDVGIIKSFSLGKEAEEKILAGNAVRLLGI